jgi:hypothetical protein
LCNSSFDAQLTHGRRKRLIFDAGSHARLRNANALQLSPRPEGAKADVRTAHCSVGAHAERKRRKGEAAH